MTDFLEKYKPTVDLSQTFFVDEKLPDDELSFDLYRKLKTARKLQDITFIAIGKMLKVIRDRKLFKQLDYEYFNQFLASEDLSFSREKAYVYIRIYELFVERLQLKEDELSQLGVVRLMMLAPVVKKIENDEEAIKKVEEAKDLRYGDFIKQNKQDTNKDGRPMSYFSEELGKWVVSYYDDRTQLIPLGKWVDTQKTSEEA